MRTVERGVTNKGTHMASAPCTLKFKWDNTFSYFYGKYLKYHVDVHRV